MGEHKDRSSYRPAEYWSERLGRHFTLRGVGHHSYTEAYNGWIYRQKRSVLEGILPTGHGKRALDVGSGVGWVVQHLLSAGYDVDGCDISPLAVERLQQSFPGASFFELALGASPAPRPDASYDVVTILDVTYHIVDDDLWERGLADLARLLRPGGHLIVLDRLGHDDDDVATHVRFRSLARWCDAATQVGLELEELKPAYRWLSRDRDSGPMRHLPQSVRGPVEFALERIAPRTPHMRCARFVRRPDDTAKGPMTHGD